MRRRAGLRVAVAGALCICALGGGVAAADQGEAVIHDCLNNGKITKHWSQKALAEALSEMSTSVSEYSACPVLIHQAQIAEAETPHTHRSHPAATAPTSTPRGPTTATPAHPHTAPATPAPAPAPTAVNVPSTPAAYTPAQRQAITAIAASGGAPVEVGGRKVLPGLVHVSVASAASALPTLLLALFCLLLAWAAFGGFRLVRRRVDARRQR